MFSLSIVIVASILAGVALFFLLGSKINDSKKQKILILMGMLIFLSILISNFKSNDIFTFSLLQNSAKNKINSIFIKEPLHYEHKYNLDQKALGEHLLQRNYAIDYTAKDYNQFIIFSSKKHEGASYFMSQLAQKLRKNNIPSFYVKMESPSGSSQQFFRKTGVNSYQAFKSSIQYYLQQKSKPYIIIDNAQLLPRPITDILASFDENKSPHIILNTENIDILLERISEVDKGFKSSSDFLRRFQIQKWVGPDQTVLERLSPSNSFIKKMGINFETINFLKNGATEQQIILKKNNANNNIANYFGLSTYYNQIKRLLERGTLSFGKLRQTNIPFEKIQHLEKLGLIAFRNGFIILQ